MLRQPSSARDISADQREELIISMRRVDGVWIIVSRYGDLIWWLPGAPTNVRMSSRVLDFSIIPEGFRASVKEALYRYMRRGRAGQKCPGYGVLVRHLRQASYFLRFLENKGVRTLSAISRELYSDYIQSLRNVDATTVTLCHRLVAVEALYELSLWTSDPIPTQPWPDTSAHELSGYNKSRLDATRKTPLIPAAEFTALFQRAWGIVQDAGRLLDLRDKIQEIEARFGELSKTEVNARKNTALLAEGWGEGVEGLESKTTEVRTACYVVVASLTGCRNHEIAYLKSGACFTTKDDDGEIYWWMRSRTSKTDEGVTEWLLPEAAVFAIGIMERWAAPLQARIRLQLAECRLLDSKDPLIAELEEHADALFLGMASGAGNIVRTLSNTRWNANLKRFKKACGLSGGLHTHQFRRTFANYAARSQFGDIRYLREHFKHWSMDMTLGYALNESQDIALYLEIQGELDDIKCTVASNWLNPSAALGGGYGAKIVNWRRRDENVVIFRDRASMVKSIAESTAIRSNGHAWCTSDSHSCPGNDLDPLRCGDGCSNAVIGEIHSPIYEGLYAALCELRACDDIGPGGRARVERDLIRCEKVLSQLGATSSSPP